MPGREWRLSSSRERKSCWPSPRSKLCICCARWIESRARRSAMPCGRARFAITPTPCVRDRWMESCASPRSKTSRANRAAPWQRESGERKLKIVIFGLSITSAWGNGHATTFRSLTRALHARGHKIVFFEKDLQWYASNRDLPDPPFCSVRIYQEWDKVLPQARREIADCDVAAVGSYFPDGLRAIDEVLDSP